MAQYERNRVNGRRSVVVSTWNAGGPACGSRHRHLLSELKSSNCCSRCFQENVPCTSYPIHHSKLPSHSALYIVEQHS